MAEKLTEAFATREEPEFIGIPEYSDIYSVSEMLVEKENILVLIGEEISNFTTDGSINLSLADLKENNEKSRLYLEERREELEKGYPNKLHFVFGRLLAFSKIIDINLSILYTSVDGQLRKAYDEIISSSIKGSIGSKDDEGDEEKKLNENLEAKEDELDIIDLFGDINEDRKFEISEGNFQTLPKVYLKGESLEDFHTNIDQITERIQEAQILVIAGKVPENSFLHAIIGNFIEFGIPIIEIGESPNLEVGNVFKIVGELHETLFELEKGIQESYSIQSGVEASNFYLF